MKPVVDKWVQLRVAGCLMLAAALLTVAIAGQVQAAVFAPVACSVCPTWTTVNWSYNSATELAPDPNSSGNYINNVYHFRYFLANAYVSQVQFELASFWTESGFDFLNIVQQGQGGGTNLTGQLSTPQWVQPTTPTMLQAAPLQLRFNSDSSVSKPGFNIDKAQVCCASSPTSLLPVRGMPNGERYTGVMLGTNDVVYLWQNGSPSGTRLHLALWGPSSGADFDVYARCNVLPTPTSWDLRGYSTDTKEFIASATDQCAGGIWYIAVNSYSGSGQFDLVASSAKVSSDPAQSGVIPLLRVGTNFDAVPGGYLPVIQATMEKALKYLYGETEGKIFFSACQIWNNSGTTCSNCGGQPCDICFESGVGPSSAPICSLASPIHIVASSGYFTAYQGVAHEITHRYLCVPDEYTISGGGSCDSGSPGSCTWLCGHTVMANPFSGNNNLCMKAGGSGTVDHLTDGTPGATLPSTASSWDWAINSSNRIVVVPSTTPDNFDYTMHDFNGTIACAIQ